MVIPRLTALQLKQLAEFTANLGIVFFATAIAPIFSSVDRINPFMIIIGLVLTVASLIMSLLILKGVNDES